MKSTAMESRNLKTWSFKVTLLICVICWHWFSCKRFSHLAMTLATWSKVTSRWFKRQLQCFSKRLGHKPSHWLSWLASQITQLLQPLETVTVTFTKHIWNGPKLQSLTIKRTISQKISISTCFQFSRANCEQIRDISYLIQETLWLTKYFHGYS